VDLYDTIILVFKLVIGLTVFFVILFVVVRPILSSLAEAQHRSERTPLHRRLPSQRLEDEELEIPTSREEDMSAENIIKIARDNPTKTTVVVRNWIHDKKQK